MNLKLTASTLCAGLLGAALWLVPAARADEWDKRTEITFGAPVEIPGQVLPPGKYVFKLMDSASDRNIVQIFNADETRLYATLLAIPDYRLTPPDKTMITFEERKQGAPEAIRAWFYPGDNYGEEFVYPKAQAMAIAETTKQPAAAVASNRSEPAQPAPAEMNKAPVTPPTPERTQPEIAQAAPPAPPVQTLPPAPAAMPKRLPRTASDLPLAALIGLTSLSAALGLRAASKRFG
jgi:hypothetical protein